MRLQSRDRNVRERLPATGLLIARQSLCRAFWHTNAQAAADAAARRDGNGRCGDVQLGSELRMAGRGSTGLHRWRAGVPFAPKALRWGRAGVIVRRPNPKPLTKASDRQVRNIAPLATVTVASAATDRKSTR